MDPRGIGGSWEDIKCLINYVVIIDATYIQVAKGRDDVTSHSVAAFAKGVGNTRSVRVKESRRCKGRSSTFYKKNNNLRGRPPRLITPIKMAVLVSLVIRRETWLGIVLIRKRVQSNKLLRRARSFFPSPTLRRWLVLVLRGVFDLSTYTLKAIQDKVNKKFDVIV